MSLEGVEQYIYAFVGQLSPTLIPVALSIYPAIRLNRKMLVRLPERQPFAWGYFQALVLILVGVMMVPIAFTNTNPFDTPAKTLVYAVLIFVLGIMLYRRNRWAWLICTIVSLNPFLWVTNGIYLKNRWKEMQTENKPIREVEPRAASPTPTKEPSPSPSHLKHYWSGRSLSSRALIAGTIFWVVCVLAFEIVSEVFYLYVFEEFIQMIVVIFVPPALAWFGRFLWRKVLKPE